MPKTRAYTREELQGLRRADLQRLCKTYDIKGANAKSDVLVETLAEYFTSPAYLATTQTQQPETSRPRAPSRLLPQGQRRPPHGPASRAPSRARPATQPSSRPTSSLSRLASAPSAASVSSGAERQRTRPAAAQSSSSGGPPRRAPPRTNDKPGANAQATGSSQVQTDTPPSGSTYPDDAPGQASELAALRDEVSQLRQTVSSWGDQESIIASLEQKMEERIAAAIDRQLAIVKQKEVDLAIREEALAQAWARLEVRREMVSASNSGATDSALASREPELKRKGRESDLEQSSVKRPRIPGAASLSTLPGSASTMVSEAPSTPDSSLSRAMQVPHTPSPQRGSSVDHSLTPNVRMEQGGRIPNFATLPKPPAEVGSPSPTPERPHPLRNGELFRPGRASRHVRRKPSQAHIDLSAITESESSEPESGPSSRRRPPFLGSIAVPERARSTVTPPALSPSPAIGESQGFSYTPLPPPFTKTAPSSATSSQGGGPQLQSQQPRQPKFNPASEYMNVALNGLTNPDESPSALATPSTRTMLGTERFRDTRFADEPLVSWTSPKVDYGPETPTH